VVVGKLNSVEIRWTGLGLGVLLLLGGVGCSGPTTRASTGVVREADVGAPLLSDELSVNLPRYVERVTDCPTAAFGTSVHAVTSTVRVDAQIAWRDLFVKRFDHDGEALDQNPIRVATFDAEGVCAPVVFAGGHFLMLWAEVSSLRCARVEEDGTVLDPEGVATGLPGGQVESVATDGTNTLVTWFGGSVAVVGSDCGAVSSKATVPVTSGATYFGGSAAFDGSRYWVAYTEKKPDAADRFAVQAVSAAGVPSGTGVTVATAPYQRGLGSDANPSVQGTVAAGGGKLVVGYASQPVDHVFSYDVHYVELDSNGSTTTSQTIATSSSSFSAPRIGFAGDGFVLASQLGSTPGSLAKRWNDGTAQTTTPTDMNTTETASISNDGTRVLLARAGGGAPSTGARLFADDLQALAPPVPLLEQVDRQQRVIAATTPQTLLVAWTDAGYTELLGSRVLHDGTLVDTEPFTILPAFSGTTAPALAGNGTDFLVAWSDYLADVFAAAVDQATGVVSDKVLLAQGNVGPARVASNGTGYLVAWTRAERELEPTPHWHVYVEGALLASDGSVLQNLSLRDTAMDDAPGAVLVIPTGKVAVTYDGSAYVVASGLPAPPGATDAPIFTQRVSTAGDVGSAVATGFEGDLTELVWGDRQALITVADDTNVLAGRIDASLAPLDDDLVVVTSSARTSSSTPGDHRISAAWDGATYWVSWKDGRLEAAHSDDLYAARVARSGVVLDPSGVVVSAGVMAEHEFSPGAQNGFAGGVLVSGADQALAVYSRFDPARDQWGWLLHVRTLGSELSAAGAGGSDAGAGGAGPTLGGSGGAIAHGGSSHGGSANGGTGHGGEPDSGGSNAKGGTAGTPDPGQAGEAGGGGSSGSKGGTTSAGGRAGGGSGNGHGGTKAGSSSAGTGSSTPPDGGDGCGCRVAGRDRSSGFSALFFAALGLPLVRRRQRRAQRSQGHVLLHGADPGRSRH
jgi:MYXO-CTERM domain-containing protein